ncbi:MAG: DNA translocase FtsK [Clostridia bacterium]|nr:DNA translocase FtsK [Clostridia bacterium]NCC43324.1 DNA translocase FtsK [Clostridia bacterium]
MPSTTTRKNTGSSNKGKGRSAASRGKTSSASKKASVGRKTSAAKGTTTARKRSTAPKQQSNGLGLEILILSMLAISILLLISNFELGGSVGTVVSRFFFGIMGWIAYVFPIILFMGTAFWAVNRHNQLIGKKMAGMILCFWCLSGLIHLLTVGYAKGDSITGYYQYCAQQKTGGGIIGGGLIELLSIAFGTIGAYVVVIIGLVISIIIMTQHPVLAPLKKTGQRVYQEAYANRVRRKEERGTFAFEQLKLKVEDPAKEEADKKTDKPEKEKISLADRRKQSKKEKEEKRTKKEMPEEIMLADELEVKDTPEFPELKIQRPDPEELFAVNEPDSADTFDMQEISAEEDIIEEEIPSAELKESKKNPKSSKKEIEDGIKNIQEEITKKEEEPKQYVFPPIDLLTRGKRNATGDSDQHLRETAVKLQTTLHNFGVNVTVTNVSCGPTVTRYELQPEQGVKVSKIVGLTDDIKLNLAAADIRIEAPIPGKAAVGIEVPNATNSAVMLRDLLESKEFREFPSELAFAVGKDIGGKTVVADIGRMPHLLIAGATGSGKSVCINTLIMSIIYKASPEEVKLIMIDPKVVELSVYNGIPHLFIPVVTDPKKASGALNWAVAEMTERYNKFAEYNVRDLKGYNDKVAQLDDIEDENKPQRMPKIVIIVDELADLMMVAPGEVEDAICRLAQLARAAGIHLIIATQRPSVNVITGLIKANMPSRVAFSVSSGVDSRTILDMNGAEKLLGKGDMLYYPQGYQKPARLQGSFVSDGEVGKVVDFLTQNHQTDTSYDQKITDMMNSNTSSAASGSGGSDVDNYFVDAGKFIIDKDKASIGMLQRVFKIGFNRAARIMDQLSEAGVVGPEEGTKPRKVLMSMEEFENYIEESL